MNNNPLKNIPPTYCLSLKEETERQTETLRLASKYEFTPEIFYGFDGRKIDLRNSPDIVGGDYFYSMSSSDIAVALGHISMIRHWLQTSNSDIALFVEDDIDFSNCENWSFNWESLINSLPTDWKVVQFSIIRADQMNEVRFRRRDTADWCVTAYIVKRSYAVWLVDQIFTGDKPYLRTLGDSRAMPIVENVIYFPAQPYMYSFPIFAERHNTFSTFYTEKKLKNNNVTYQKVYTDWWKMNGRQTPLQNFFNTLDRPVPIPMIGTATVNGGKWLKRLIASVDHPVNEFLIINNNGRGQIDAELDDLAKNHGNTFISKIRVLHMPMNIGVAASWNLMIKSYLRCPYWIIVNDDVAFGAGFLAEMYINTIRDPGAGIIHGFQGDHGQGSWDLFLIRDQVIQEHGLFDENLYPAYAEDCDYYMRLLNKPIRRVMNLEAEYYHGDGKKNEYYTHGSQTRKANPELDSKLARVNELNIDYLTHKWGPNWRTQYPSATPFMNNNGAFPISATTFDIGFAREKYLGF